MSDERRSFVRVGADCMIKYGRSSSANEKKRLPSNQNNPTSTVETLNIAAKIRANGDQGDKLILELLLWIDWKVNYLIRALTEDKENFIFPYEAHMIDLSGEGMKFSTNEEILVETNLQFRFFLPVIPFKEMFIDGVVTRVKEKSIDDHSLPSREVGVEFCNIKESDQESIFRYVAKRERQILQERREKKLEGYKS